MGKNFKGAELLPELRAMTEHWQEPFVNGTSKGPDRKRSEADEAL